MGWGGVNALPNEETFCSGQVTVPNIYNVPIILARMMLKEYGWQPEQSRQEPDATSQGLLDMGINEVDGCAGTGCGFCRFAYKYALTDFCASRPVDKARQP